MKAEYVIFSDKDHIKKSIKHSDLEILYSGRTLIYISNIA